MKKDAKKVKDFTIQHYSSYHCGNGQHSRLLYFSSDRPEEVQPDGMIKHANGKTSAPKAYGFEMELESNTIHDRGALAAVLGLIFGNMRGCNDLFKIETDATLGMSNGAGLEVIPQMMTKEFIRNHYSDFHYMYKMFDSCGISPAFTDHCGMHVNISKSLFGSDADTAAKKLFYIINHHFDTFRVMMRRGTNTHWCYRQNYSVDQIKNTTAGPRLSDHGSAVNFQHWNESIASARLEIRLPGGQPDFKAFRECMEIVFFLVERSKSISWADCDNIVAIFKGCNTYVANALSIAVVRGFVSSADADAIANTINTKDDYTLHDGR